MGPIQYFFICFAFHILDKYNYSIYEKQKFFYGNSFPNSSTIFLKTLKSLLFKFSVLPIARQFITLNTFICLTYHLSTNLKFDRSFTRRPTNQRFWFHLSDIPRVLMVIQTKLCALFKLILLSFFRKDFTTEDFVGYV